MENGTIGQLLVSGDGETWMPATRFIRLIGQESWLDAQQAAAATERLKFGQLEHTTLVAVLARLVRDAFTGRLVMERGHSAGGDRGEIHFVNGQPTLVHVSGDEFQMANILTKRGHLRNDLIGGYLHRSLQHAEPLERILAVDAGFPPEHWRLTAMRDRFNHLMGWQAGRYGFDDQRLPSTLRPFAPSILALAREYVTRHMEDRRLADWLLRHQQDSIQPSAWLNPGVAALRLNPEQLELVSIIVKRKTVAQALEAAEQDPRTARALLYLMLESDILLKPL